MPVVTKITTQKKNTERYNVFLDYGKGEEYAFSVDEYVLTTFAIRKGQNLTDDEIAEIQYEDHVKKAHNLALTYLSYRMRSVKEVQQYLQTKEMGDDAIRRAIEKLLEYRYLNDLEFAKAYVRTNMRTNSKGPGLLKQELIEKGITGSDIEESLLEYDEELQLENALKLIEKTRKKSQKQSEKMMKQKAKTTLLTKGFDLSLITKALHEVSLEKDEDEQWEALKKQGEKAHRRYRKYEDFQYTQKMKTHLYQKGFPLEQINKLLDYLAQQND
ncbi:recombination regulator RecX [Priestia filamentosa]|uniref:recombination regulator RecX n=1 Tax=Priestia filamentosa TaxID=1402861 RepID=UPI001FB4C2A6|nr:recombination regulator RecX [Priestia filamentosa]MED3727989.1 recombination regulator RecX [Priestia filamentosa]UOE60141.1 recombination regulator RecX [Priestia filamentosa]